MDINFLAYNQYRGYVIYSELAQVETSPHFKKILQNLARHEGEHFNFWKQFSTTKKFTVSPFERWRYRFARKTLGLVFIARFLERHEQKLIGHCQHFIRETHSVKLKKQARQIIYQEQQNEQILISQIKEEKVEFISSIVLGLSDGLIEITGALVGFALAFGQNSLVALTGSITGLAAALSMSSSAYMQASYEQKDARKAAVYTGITYLAVVALLLLPFLITSTISAALIALGTIILFIIGGTSYYTAILFQRPVQRQFLQMLTFTVGVAAVTFMIGILLRHFFEVGL